MVPVVGECREAINSTENVYNKNNDNDNNNNDDDYDDEEKLIER